MSRPLIGLGFQSDKTPDEYVRLAKLAEEKGVDVVSVYGDLGYQPPIFPLILMARATERVRLGPACLNPFSLAPYEIAGQIAALDLVSNGRAYLGIARGAWLDEVGIDQSGSVVALREAVEVVSRLLSSNDAGFEGEMFRLAPGSRLNYRPVRPDPPVMVGTWGPKTLAMAGEVANEVKIGGSANPEVVPWARDRISEGARTAGRAPDEVGICVGAVSVVDEDGTAARSLARREVAMYLAVVASLDPTTQVDPAVLSEVRQRVAAGAHQEAGDLISDELLDRFAFAGTPEQVAEHAQRLVDAGATRIEFGTPHGLTYAGGVRLIGDRIVPHFS